MESKEELLQKVYDLGLKYEKTYHGCAQCVIGAVQDVFGIDDSVFKAASTLSAGVCSMGHGPCGALSGAMLVLGYYYGRDRDNFSDIEKARYAAKHGRTLWCKFTAEYGSIFCKDVQTRLFGRWFNLLDPKDREEFEAQGGHSDKCPVVVGNTARWLAEILLANPPEKGFDKSCT